MEKKIQDLIDGGTNFHLEKALIMMDFISMTNFEGSVLEVSTEECKGKVIKNVHIIKSIHKIR